MRIEEFKLDHLKSYVWKSSNDNPNCHISVRDHSIEIKNDQDKDNSHSLVSFSDSDNDNELEFEQTAGRVYSAQMMGNSIGNINIQILISGKSGDGKIVYNQYIGLDEHKILEIPLQVKSLGIRLRVQGIGESKLDLIQFTPYLSKNEALQNYFGKNESSEYLILTNVYPEKNNLYRNMFVHRRAELYKENFVNVDVFRFNERDKSLGYYKFENIDVYSGFKDELAQLIKHKNYKKILIHFVDKNMITALNDSNIRLPLMVWIHGVETEKWYRRWFNFYQSSSSLSQALGSINSNLERVQFMRYLYETRDLDIHFIFVSKWFKEEIAELDTGASVENYSIIHNVIDDSLFNHVPKTIEHRKKILSIRPFASKKYANDLSVKAILLLSEKPFFNDLEFNIYGSGLLLEETLEPLLRFENVNIHDRFLNQNEIAQLHKQHGLFLCPTRLDAQGVSMCESMSSGLVPITNGVTAIPEFVRSDCGILARKENSQDLADGIETLYNNPDLFLQMPSNAATSITEQCGKEKIIAEELSIILK